MPGHGDAGDYSAQAFADMTSRYEFFKETVPTETKTLVQDVLFKASCSFAEFLIIEVVQDVYNRPALAEQSKEAVNTHIKHLRAGNLTVQDIHPVVWSLAQKVVRKQKLD